MGKNMEALAIYHEKQSLELCLLHSLNNLFQGMAFSKASLDAIASELAPDARFFNPHKSCLGTGNYDVNILIAALATKDCVPKWFDRRKDPANINLEKVVGLILNTPSSPRLGYLTVPVIKRRHWVAVVWVGGAWYNLDSKLAEPEALGSESELLAWLAEKTATGQTELFVVLPNAVDADNSWLRQEQTAQAS